tara:strand:+ start:47 stop:238 length:192 start_codon:yes stop_codon:yes gene_type:complete
MGLVKQSNKKPQENNPVVYLESKLDKNEIGIILTLVKQSAFKGEDVEKIYNMVTKLQNQLKNV